MINRKNFYVLAAVVFVACFAYLGILTMTGFTKFWGVWRIIAFYVLTYMLTFWPTALLLKIYAKSQEPVEPPAE